MTHERNHHCGSRRSSIRGNGAIVNDDSPLLVRKGGSRVERLSHWNRRAWQEIAILKKRIELLEGALNQDTGGDYEFAPEGDPWEKEVIYERNYGMVLAMFIFGFVMGAVLMFVMMI